MSNKKSSLEVSIKRLFSDILHVKVRDIEIIKLLSQFGVRTDRSNTGLVIPPDGGPRWRQIVYPCVSLAHARASAYLSLPWLALIVTLCMTSGYAMFAYYEKCDPYRQGSHYHLTILNTFVRSSSLTIFTIGDLLDAHKRFLIKVLARSIRQISWCLI